MFPFDFDFMLVHREFEAKVSTIAFLGCTSLYINFITGRQDSQYSTDVSLNALLCMALGISLIRSLYNVKDLDRQCIATFSNNIHSSLQEATSTGIPLGWLNHSDLDRIRRTAALSKIRTTMQNDFVWWTTLPPRLADTFKTGRVNFLGFELFNAPVATLNMDELPSLAESIKICQNEVDAWAIDTLTKPDPHPMDVTRYSIDDTLGKELFASSQRSRSITDQLGLPPFSRPGLLKKSDNIFHVTLIHNGSPQQIICSTPENASRWQNTLPELVDIQPIDPSAAYPNFAGMAPQKNSYAYPLAGWLTFPPPRQYQGNLALQQLHAALLYFISANLDHKSVPVTLYFMPSHFNLPVTINNSTMRARIQNTLMPHIGTLNYDMIKKQFPDFETALARFREQPITLPDTVSHTLHRTHGAAEITKQFALSHPLLPLINPGLISFAYCLAITTPHNKTKEWVFVTDFRNSPNNLIEQLNNGNHLVLDHEKEDKDAHDTAPHEKFWTDPHYAYKGVKLYLQSSGRSTTFAEATSTALPHLIPPSYNGDVDRLRLHSALYFLCGFGLNTIMHIPPSCAHLIQDQSETQGRKYVRFGNIVLEKYTFDWANVQARYPTLLDATQAAQKRMFRWLSDPAHPQAYPPSFYLPPQPGYMPTIGAVLTGHLTRTEGHSWFPEFDFQLPSLSYRLSVPPNWPESRHTHDPEIAFMDKINGKKTLDEHCSCALCEIDLTNHCAKYLHRDVVFTVISYVFTPTRSQNQSSTAPNDSH